MVSRSNLLMRVSLAGNFLLSLKIRVLIDQRGLLRGLPRPDHRVLESGPGPGSSSVICPPVIAQPASEVTAARAERNPVPLLSVELVLPGPKFRLSGRRRWRSVAVRTRCPRSGRGDDGRCRRSPDDFDSRVLRTRRQRFCMRSEFQLASAVQPPSTGSATPLTKPLRAGAARKATAWAMSSGAANRAMGTRSTMSESV
jgi:hypothetical protein